MSVKLHLFTESYDIFKYNKKVSVTEDTFNSRRDKYIFGKLANLIHYEEGYQFFTSQFIYRDLVTPASIENNFPLASKVFERWKKNIANMYENYDDDLKYIAKNCEYDWKNCFVTDGIDYPLLFKMVMGQKIHAETYSILIDLFQYNPIALRDDMLYKGLNLKYRKYNMMLNCDKKTILEKTPRDLKIFLDKAS